MKGPDVLTRLDLLWHEKRTDGENYNSFCVIVNQWMKHSMKEKPVPLWLEYVPHPKKTAIPAIQPLPTQAKDATSLSRIQSSSSTPWEHAYSACVTTNDGRPSAYMLTAVSCPHPGNDCVINPEPLFKLLLTAEGENGINCLCSPVTNALLRTVWATLTIRHCQRPTWDVGCTRKVLDHPESSPPIVREHSYGMFFNHCADEGSHPQITSQFVNSRK